MSLLADGDTSIDTCAEKVTERIHSAALEEVAKTPRANRGARQQRGASSVYLLPCAVMLPKLKKWQTRRNSMPFSAPGLLAAIACGDLLAPSIGDKASRGVGYGRGQRAGRTQSSKD